MHAAGERQAVEHGQHLWEEKPLGKTIRAGMDCPALDSLQLRKGGDELRPR